MNPRMEGEGVDFEFWARKYHLREKTWCCVRVRLDLTSLSLVILKSVHDAFVNGGDDLVWDVIGVHQRHEGVHDSNEELSQHRARISRRASPTVRIRLRLAPPSPNRIRMSYCTLIRCRPFVL